MYPRPFLKRQRIGILVDSTSIDHLLLSSDRRSQALLRYRNNRWLDFVRTPEKVIDKGLQEIVKFEKVFDEKGAVKAIKITRDETLPSLYGFRYQKDTLERIGKIVFEKDQLNTIERKTIELASTQATLNKNFQPYDDLNIMITERVSLLKNRLRLESLLENLLNIVNVKEAVEIIDLFLKSHNDYPISWFLNANKGYWYWLSFRTRIPFYNVDVKHDVWEKSILETLAQRFVFALMSVDEIGFQYYSGVDNDTMDATVYHFNYLISLITGISDSLALQAFNQYKLKFKDSNIRSRISLHNENGKNFLRALRLRNPALREHIENYTHFIKAIYILRKHIIHREALREMGFENRTGGWKANLISIPEELTTCLSQAGDTEEKYEPWTEFGVYSSSFLEPYKFSKKAIITLTSLCNGYLQLLGFSNYVEEIEKHKPEDDFTKTISDFKSDNLGL